MALRSDIHVDYDEPVELADGLYWVGRWRPGHALQCNTYLITSPKAAAVVDPGSMAAFPVVMRKILDVITPERITEVIVNHADPDVCGSLPVIEQVVDHRSLRVVSHPSTRRLLREIDLRATLVSTTELGDTLLLGDRELRFVDTPFLHAPGAVATFDVQTGALLSGDLFGALDPTASLLAADGFLDALDVWHETYMSSDVALAHSLEVLERLPLRALLPHHGSIIDEADIPRAFAHLRTLHCGIDRIAASP